MLIENSTKINHPLNAEFLHSILLNKPLNVRDLMWTTFINDIDDSQRIIQLINYFNEGNTLSGLSSDNIFLLLILFTWLLTSSNRFTRDIASKAIIELFDTRSFCYRNLITFKQFQSDIEMLKPRKSG